MCLLGTQRHIKTLLLMAIVIIIVIVIVIMFKYIIIQVFFFLHLSCLFKQVFYIYLPHSIKNGNQDINYSSFMGLFMLLCVLVRIICCLSTRYVPIWYSLKIDKNLNQSHHTFYEIYNFDQYFNTHLINFIKIY